MLKRIKRLIKLSGNDYTFIPDVDPETIPEGEAIPGSYRKVSKPNGKAIFLEDGTEEEYQEHLHDELGWKGFGKNKKDGA